MVSGSLSGPLGILGLLRGVAPGNAPGSLDVILLALSSLTFFRGRRLFALRAMRRAPSPLSPAVNTPFSVLAPLGPAALLGNKSLSFN